MPPELTALLTIINNYGKHRQTQAMIDIDILIPAKAIRMPVNTGTNIISPAHVYGMTVMIHIDQPLINVGQSRSMNNSKHPLKMVCEGMRLSETVRFGLCLCICRLAV